VPASRRAGRPLRASPGGTDPARTLGPFIVDFFAPAASLVIEVDGGIHRTQVHRDALRDAALHARGLRVLRIDAELVLHDVAGAIARIRSALAP